MRRRQTRGLRFESLEGRRLLAVTVSTTNSGDLLIAGDAADDWITISENSFGTHWTIEGQFTSITSLIADADPVEPELQIPKPTTENVLILLDGGTDSLTMLGINQGFDHDASEGAVSFVGQTTIQMGSGSDGVNLGGHLGPIETINIPIDEDTVQLRPYDRGANDFIGAVSIALGGDATSIDTTNSLKIENTNFGQTGGTPVNGRLDIAGSSGADTIRIRNAINFGGSINVHTDAGADVVTVGSVFPVPHVPEDEPPGPSPQDAVQLTSSLNVDLGDGNDQAVVEQVLAGGNLIVSGGAGNDDIRFGSKIDSPPDQRFGTSARGDIIVQAGDGDDTLLVNQATTAGALHVALGDGAAAGQGNSLSVQNSSFSAASSISGGAQVDDVQFSAVNSPLGLHIQTAGGNDHLSILGTLVELGVASILTSAGNDTVEIGGGSRMDTLIIATGDGNDTVTFGGGAQVGGNASVDDFFLDLGAGDDRVDSGTSMFVRAFVQGGAGANTRAGQVFGADVEGDFLFFEGFGP